MLSWLLTLLLRLSLHRRITVFVFSILLAVFLAFGVVGWAAVTRSKDEEFNERLLTAQVVARHLDFLISDAFEHMQAAAEAIAAQGDNLDEVGSSPFLQFTLRQQDYYFNQVLVFDDKLQLVTGIPAASSATLDSDTQAFLDQALQGSRPVVSNLLRLPVRGRPGVLFAEPIVRNQRVLGLVVAQMQLPHPALSSVDASVKFGRTGHLELLDGRGYVLAGSHDETVGEKTEHPEFYLPLLASRESTVGRSRYFDQDGTLHPEVGYHITAFAPLTQASWGLGLGQDEDEAFAETYDLRNRSVALAAIALAVALGFAWVGTRSIVKPIQALTSAGERMATGNLSEPIGIEQPDEVGRLAHAMEVMRQRLDQSLTEIRSWNQVLEERVHLRTGELEARNRHLQALMAVATVTSRRADRQEVLHKALQELGETLDVVAAWAFLWDEKQESLELVAGYRLPERLRLAEASISAPDAACLVATRTSQPASQVQRDCPALPVEVHSLVEGTRCWCGPIRVGEECLGVLCLAVAEDRALQDDELALFQGITQEVAIAFENARLTEERARLEATQRMELLRAEFLASVSHELRTPLGFVKGYATTLLREDVKWTGAQRREFLEIIDEECDRLGELVEGLLDSARAQAGRLQLRLEPVSPAQVIHRSVERMSGLLGNHSVTLDVASSPTILADEARLEQVIVNLLQNAVKYSPDGGPIEVHLAARGQHIQISVLDQGIGIRPADVTKVFEPFYRATNGSTTTVGGAGLGLTICRSIVVAHGGRIWAEARPGGGTAVHFTLPVRESEREERVDEQKVRVGD